MFKDRNQHGEHCNMGMTLLNCQEDNWKLERKCEVWPETYRVSASKNLSYLTSSQFPWWIRTKRNGWVWPSSVSYLVTLGWESMASYLDIVWSLFPQICHRVQGRENAWPDPYMVTLGWAYVTYLELRGRNWTSICCSKTRHHAMAYSHLHSDPGVSLENPTVGELRQRYGAA